MYGRHPRCHGETVIGESVRECVVVAADAESKKGDGIGEDPKRCASFYPTSDLNRSLFTGAQRRHRFIACDIIHKGYIRHLALCMRKENV